MGRRQREDTARSAPGSSWPEQWRGTTRIRIGRATYARLKEIADEKRCTLGDVVAELLDVELLEAERARRP